VHLGPVRAGEPERAISGFNVAVVGRGDNDLDVSRVVLSEIEGAAGKATIVMR